MPKAKLVGAKLALDAAPVPERSTVWGLPVALSVTVIVAGRLPIAVGVNVTLMEQLAPAAREAPQVLVSPYGALATMLVMFSAAVPELVNVTLRRAGGVHILIAEGQGGWREADAGCDAGAGESDGLRAASCVIRDRNRPGWLPAAVGVKVTLMEQLAPAAREAPQVLVWEYGALAAMVVMFSAAVPELVSVTVCAALVVFRF